MTPRGQHRAERRGCYWVANDTEGQQVCSGARRQRGDPVTRQGAADVHHLEGQQEVQGLVAGCHPVLLPGKQQGNEGLCAADTFYQNSKRRRPHTMCGSIHVKCSEEPNPQGQRA